MRLNPAQIAIEVAGLIILDTYIEVIVVERLPSVWKRADPFKEKMNAKGIRRSW